VKLTEHTANTASTARIGLFATLGAFLRGQGSSAPATSATGVSSARRALATLAAFVVALGALTFAAAPALAAAPPTVGEESVSDVSSTSATLEGQVDPGGAETTYRFEYAPSGGAFVPLPESQGSGVLAAGATGVALSVHMQQGLVPGSSDEFRLVASNSVETVTGEPVSFTTQTVGGAFALPDGRQYELVTPPQKQGALFESITPDEENIIHGADLENSENVIQASAAGTGIVDVASQPTEVEPLGYSKHHVSVISTRGASGWSSQVIVPPYAEATNPEGGVEYRRFSQDLSHGVLQPEGNFDPLLSPEATESTAFLRNNGECEPTATEKVPSTCYTPLVTRSDDTHSPFEPFGEEAARGCFYPSCGPEYLAATPNLSHVILAAGVQLTATPIPKDEEGERRGLYEWSGGQLQLISILPGSEEGDELYLPSNNDRGGTAAGGRNEVSDDGERVILTGSRDIGVYLREVANKVTVQLDLPEPGCVACGSGGGGAYMAASSDGSRIFFADGERLTGDSITSGGGRDLYEYNLRAPVGDRLTDLTVDPNAGETADVRMVLGASEDGSYIYFVAGGALAPGAAGDDECEKGDGAPCNLYVRHEGVTRFIAELSGADEARWNTVFSIAGQHARVSPDGRWLAFMSDKDLTGYDIRDAVSGHPDDEVYLYHAPEDPATEAGTLACASCDPTGARPVGFGSSGVASFVPGWTVIKHRLQFAQGYQPRYISDGGRLFFDSEDTLVPQDVNGLEDVYEYEPEGEHCSSLSVSGSEVFKPARSLAVEGTEVEEGAGCVGLISSGSSREESSFLEASETGGDVFFLTSARLVSQDVEGGYSVFDAHECTGAAPCFAEPAVQPLPCETEASCKAPPTPQPAIYDAPASATFSGPSNISPAPAPAVVKRAVKSKRCSKGKKLERGRCIKVKRRTKRTKKAIKSTKSSDGGKS